MALHFCQIPARGCPDSEAELNRFLGQHRVVSIDRRWVELGEHSYWAICVDYLAAGVPADTGPAGPTRTSRRGVDYRELLSVEDFAVFARIREWRNNLAAQEKVPAYQILANEQAAQIARDKLRTKADLARVKGIGPARLEKYGEPLARMLSEMADTNEANGDETSGESVSTDS